VDGVVKLTSRFLRFKNIQFCCRLCCKISLVFGNHPPLCDCLCGLVPIVLGYKSRDPCSIHGATRFSEKQWVWNGVHSAS
jgi:hypothetical protein